MLKIDGSFGEGGGQILRTAIALSCLTGKATEIYNIRANRPNPGLAAQHLKGIEVAKLVSDAEVEGLKIGSKRVVFKPRRLKGGNFKVDIGTAGSVTLILQTILLPSLFAEKESTFEIIGGTDVSWSPPVDYFRFVTLKALKELGAKVDLRLIKRGYYPKGGGKIFVKVEPSKLKGKEFEPIKESIKGLSHCQNLPRSVAERQAEAAKKFLENKKLNAEIEVEVSEGLSTGSGITVWSSYKGGSSLGEKGKRAETVGEEAAKNFLEEYLSDSVFDSYLADQVMTFAAVASGSTSYTTSKVTLHQISNAFVINKFFENAVEIDEKRKLIVVKGLA
ncbi:MAG: RNA 3'-terminal phosphate cyclase [Archaeoglobaceae archaeon]|nr:RNA 3'-terminal phosphate cyclase [Archaeoglobaceae archaeon]MCX8152249.1 RNA 3'-terminal phosphate cyclase [Archaeoglobaceae archaeon]MDW8013927.1 RNA 3'-terminal phosphate cyclase [Archaeoglobaceae archaeon]